MENKGIVIYLICLTVIICLAISFMLFYYHKKFNNINTEIDEIKSKIGAVVRSFNINAIQENDINMQHQDEIAALKEKI
jgi:cell division protein FtsL